MKKTAVISASVLLALTLAACGKTNKQEQTSSKPKVTAIADKKSGENKSQATSQKKASTPWNADKDKQLEAFMAKWGPSMHQAYEKCTPDNPGDFYGVEVPNSVYNGKMPLAIDDINNQVKATWNSEGKGDKDTYIIVACYSDAKTQRYMEKHVYLFTIYNGQPVTLVSMQNQGNERNSFVFSPTKNDDVRQGFANIYQGQGTNSSQQSSSSQSSTDNQNGLPSSLDQALQAYYTYQTQRYGNSHEEIVSAVNDGMLSTISVTNVSGKPVMEGMTSKTYPQNTYRVMGEATLAGILTFQRISDTQIKVYGFPSHYDPQWDDPTYADEQFDKILANPTIMNLKSVDNDTMNLMRAHANQD